MSEYDRLARIVFGSFEKWEALLWNKNAD